VEDITSVVLEYRFYIEVLLIALAGVTVVSSVDDIFVDIYYWCLKLFGRQDKKDLALAASVSKARNQPERPLAIMVPAWHEHDVIYSMVATNSRLLAYRNYHYFIGVYQNDAATISEVRRA
jgi:adsorption protein B